GALRDHHRVRLRQHAARIALDQGQRDHREEIGIDDGGGLDEAPVAQDQRHALRHQPGGGAHFGDLLAHGKRHGHGGMGGGAGGRGGGGGVGGGGVGGGGRGGKRESPPPPPQPLGAGDPSVIGQFVLDEDGDENDAGERDGETGDIDEAVELVARDRTQRGEE